MSFSGAFDVELSDRLADTVDNLKLKISRPLIDQ